MNDDEIYIGNLPGVQNSTVTMGMPTLRYGHLEITSGMTLDMNGGELVSFDQAVITGDNSRLIVRPSAGPNVHDFQGQFSLGSGAYLQLEDNVDVRLFGPSEANGIISGRGHILIGGNIPFSLGGTIDPHANGGIIITQGQLERSPIDLDSPLGNGHLKLDTPLSTLEINASYLYDSFSGTISLAPGALLTMNLEGSWLADSSSSINVAGLNNPAASSKIAGSDVELNGAINVGGAQGHLRVLANATLLNQVNVLVGATDWLEFDGNIRIEGGQYLLSQDAQLDFDGPTTIEGGQFTTFNNLSSDGAVDLNGLTTWRGAVVINGIARQVGDAAVNNVTNIQANVFDMDGNGGTVWNVNHLFTLSADRLHSHHQRGTRQRQLRARVSH